MKKEKFIDIDKIIADKNPKLLKRMPGFILRYLKRIIHEDEINSFLEVNADKRNQEFCEAVVKYFNITIEVNHLERIPKEGNIIIAMNHPLGGMDAMILVHALRNNRQDLKFIVNDILMNLENLKDMFVGVDKVNKGKIRSSLRDEINQLFASDSAVCIFPAGMVSRFYKGKIQDFEWKKTFVTHARRNNSVIVPIYIDGKLSKFFYNLYRIRKFFGIKSNIEMLYLSNEMFKQRNRKLSFTVGTPIEASNYHLELNDKDAASKIRSTVYSLADK